MATVNSQRETSDSVVINIVVRWPVVTMTVAVPWSFAIQLSELNC